MYVFSHLHKAAGTTVNHLLRRTFGLGHLDVVPKSGSLYTESDLRSDLSGYIKPQSIAGHGLRPHINYGDFEHAMEWYTIIRDPIDRCLSHYQYQVQEMNNKASFSEWIKEDLHRNWMVYFYGGSDSLESAVDALNNKNVRIIDIADGLKKGMQYLFGGQLKWRDGVRNPAKNNQITDQIRAKKDLMAELLEANELDLELYRHMKQLKTVPFPDPITVSSSSSMLNTPLSFLHRNLIYRTKKRLCKE